MKCDLDECKFGLRMLWRPGDTAKRQRSVRDSLLFYYYFSLVPLLLYVAAGYVFYHYLGATAIVNFMPMMRAFMRLPVGFGPALLVDAVVLFWILTPIGIAIDAFLYQLVGRRLLNAWKGDYSKTFTALMYAVLPQTALYWLFAIPIVNILALPIIATWAIVVLVIALAAQQRIRRTDAAIVVATTAGLALLVVFLLMAGLFLAVLGGYGQSMV